MGTDLSTIGRIERVKLREVWPHEALDFTTWLADNIDVLSDAIGLGLTTVDREQPAGAFKVDIIAENEGDRVVVENQLEKSNHEHLGKLLTYLVAMEARRAIWIVADPRPEHIAVISWLNENSPEDFHLLKIETIRIGESDPAPLLTQIVGPSEDLVIIDKKELAEGERLRRRFFERLLRYANSKTDLHAKVSPHKYGRFGWIPAGAGMSGVTYNYCVLKHSARVELYIADNKKMFDALQAKAEKIESGFGDSLRWEKLGKGCRISRTYDAAGYRDDNYGEAVYEPLVDGMIKLEAALAPILKKRTWES